MTVRIPPWRWSWSDERAIPRIGRQLTVASDLDLWTEGIGALVAGALLPFYIGFLHLTVGEFLLYAGVAGALMALAERLQSGGAAIRPLWDYLDDALLWTQMVIGLGAISYLVAVILV